MRSLRALLFVTAASLAACGGLLGFGDDDEDETPAPSPPADSSTTDATPAPDVDPGPTSDASDDAALDAIVTGDAGVDVIDNTPIDAGPNILVLAQFETAIQGGDGADVATNFAQANVGAIGGSDSAHTLAGRPALLQWTFAPHPTPSEPKLFITFALRIVTMPSGAGAEVMRLTGAGGSVSILIASTGTFGLRSGTVDAPGSKMSVGVVYRIALEIDGPGSVARAGFTTSGIPTPTESVPWSPGGMSGLQIGTNNAAFDFLVDDVVVATKAPK